MENNNKENINNRSLEKIKNLVNISMILSFVCVIFVFLNMYQFNDITKNMMDFIAKGEKDGILTPANHQIQLSLILIVLIVTLAYRNRNEFNIMSLIVDIIISIILIIAISLAKPTITLTEGNEVIKGIVVYPLLLCFIIVNVARIVISILVLINIIKLIKIGEIDNPFKDGDIIETAISETQDAMTGNGDNFTSDIPATFETDSGRRVVNEVQTRRNINKKIFGNKLFLFPLVIMIIAIISLIISFIL